MTREPKRKPELWELSAIESREQYEAVRAEAARLSRLSPSLGSEDCDRLAALSVLSIQYELERENAL